MGKGRRPCCDKEGVKKGPWSEAEDLKLIAFIQRHGHSNWRALPKLAGLARCGKSCRLRWVNYLRPDLKRGNFTPHEEEAIIKLHETLGNKWSKIASHFPRRTDNEIKNVWNTHLKKRVTSKSLSAEKSKEENIKDCQPIDDMLITMDIELSSSSSTSCSSQTSSTTTEHQTADTNNTSHQEVQNPNSDTFTNHGLRIEDSPTLEELIEISFEPDLDLWSLLDDDYSNISANTHELVQLNEAPLENDKKFNYVEDGTNWCPWWVNYLENELDFDSF